MIMADSLEHMGVKPAEYKPQLPIFARLMIQETRNAAPAFDEVDFLLTDTMLMPVLFLILRQSYPSILGGRTENCEEGAEATASAAAEEEVELEHISRFEPTLIDWRPLRNRR
jgi:hypothetical protein